MYGVTYSLENIAANERAWPCCIKMSYLKGNADLPGTVFAIDSVDEAGQLVRIHRLKTQTHSEYLSQTRSFTGTRFYPLNIDTKERIMLHSNGQVKYHPTISLPLAVDMCIYDRFGLVRFVLLTPGLSKDIRCHV